MMRSMIWRWLPVILWMGVIFLGSSSSNPYQSLPGGWAGRCIQIIPWENLGKLICQEDAIGIISHILEYAVLSLLLTRAFNVPAGKIERREAGLLLLAFLVTAVFALSDEFHQIFVPGRAFQIFDLGLDLTGAATGVVLFRIIKA